MRSAGLDGEGGRDGGRMEALEQPGFRDAHVRERAVQLLAEHRDTIFRRTDRLFASLLAVEWLGAIAVALLISPRTWAGQYSQIHIHVWAALLLGGLIAAFPIVL